MRDIPDRSTRRAGVAVDAGQSGVDGAGEAHIAMAREALLVQGHIRRLWSQAPARKEKDRGDENASDENGAVKRTFRHETRRQIADDISPSESGA